jgi:hypothetical protein
MQKIYISKQTCFQHKYNKNNTSMHIKYIFKLVIYIYIYIEDQSYNMHTNNGNNNT